MLNLEGGSYIPWPSAMTLSMSFINESIEVAAPRRIGPGPPIRAEACTHLSFRLLSKVVHRFVDDRGAGAFGDGVPSAQDPRRPGVVALEHRRGGERDQRVDERELVVELADTA